MKRTGKIILGCLLVVVSLMLTISCQHKDLCYYHPHVAPVKIKVDWNGYNIDGMTAFLFARQDMSQTINTTVTTHQVEHIQFDLLEGKYDVAIFNNIAEEFTTVRFNNLTDYNNASVQAAEIKVPSWFTKYDVKSSDIYIASQPEWVARCLSKDITVTKEMVKIAEEEYLNGDFTMTARTVTLVDQVTPDSLTSTFNIKVKLKGIDSYYQARAIVSGLAIGRYIISTEQLNETVSHYASAGTWKLVKGTLNADNTGIIDGNITCFGLPKGNQTSGISLTIEIMLADKKTIITYDKPIDIGHLVKIDPITNNIYMAEAIEFPVELPYVNPEDGTEGGFNVGFEDWEKEEIEILKH